jgi:Xylose isomerase-like TIM barrel
MKAYAWIAICLAPALCLSPTSAQQKKPVRVYSTLLNPREHPDDARRHVRPPSWETFGHRTLFTALRGFEVKDGRLVRYKEELDKYTREHELAEIIWPSYPILFANNLGDLADEIRDRKLFLFDIWGYVPGSGPGGYWQQFEPPPGVFQMLESKLGDRWLGMDVGEQDGRYIGGYAPQMYPVSAGRFDQYLNFHRHFERFTTDLGNRMATLVSLNFGHYFLKEGIYTLIGAETAQALPNGQVYYSFIRGAGKQYGVPWFGNASVWNRWGHKTYSDSGSDFGPTKGTSVSLLKRLLYSHILYNSVLVGFESAWFDGDGKLTPIGRVQESANRWVKQNGQPGVMMTPIAVMADFFSGWSFPRHLYSRHVYRVWGNLPYEAGDHLTDGVLDMIYPGYQDSSYFHDETGFITPTPYGDAADALLSDAPGWLLARYPVVVVAGELLGDIETRDKLEEYVRQGGHLVITAGNIAKWNGGIGGVTAVSASSTIAPKEAIQIAGTRVVEDQAFEALGLHLPAAHKVLARSIATLAAEVPFGKGRLTVLDSPFGVPKEAMIQPVRNEIDKPLAKPYPLLKHVRAILDAVFHEHVLFEAGDGLSVIVCRKGVGEYTLGITNNSWRERPFRIVSRIGKIESVKELPLDRSEWGAAGHVPEGVDASALGSNTDRTIAGGDIRVFSVRVRDENVEEIPHAIPPPGPRGRAVPLRSDGSIQEQILKRPSFFQHFDTAVIDWRYLHDRETEALNKEARWLKLQGLKVIVDLTSGLNLYPDLRIIDNIGSDYAASMRAIDSVLSKMQILDSRDLILSLHRVPENNFTRDETWAAFEKTLRRICEQAQSARITVHLRMEPGKPPSDLKEAAAFVARVNVPNLKIAPSTAMLLAAKTGPEALSTVPPEKIGMWLLATPARDIGGSVWQYHGPVAGKDSEALLRALLADASGIPLILDAVYPDQDAEYLDARALDRLAGN